MEEKKLGTFLWDLCFNLIIKFFIPSMINFFYETEFQLFSQKSFTSWLKNILNNYSNEAHEINYIFCGDSYLLTINQKYLNHDNFTDVITFDLSEEKKLLADIYISTQRIKENAQELAQEFDKELKRVMIHAVLHLMGYKDKTEKEKKIMREKEDFYIALFKEEEK